MSTVAVAWRTDGTSAERLLVQELVRHLGHDDFVVSRACAACGSGDHGRPLVAADRPVDVSLSRTDGLVVVAVSDAGPVGIDAERAGAADFRSFDRVARHPDDPAGGDPTRTWVRKEAVLKATGHGLAIDPRHVRLAASPAEPATLDPVPGLPDHGPVWMTDLAVPAGFVATVAVVGADAPTIIGPAGAPAG